MHSSKTLFSSLLMALFTLSLLFSTQTQATTSNNDLRPFAILGAIGSIGFACYEGKGPCLFSSGVDTDKLTFSLDAGSDNTTDQLRLGLGADWKEAIYEAPSWEIVGRLEGSLHRWSSTLKNPKNDSGYIIGLTPVFHYQPKNHRYTPFIEMGGGPHLLSDITIGNEYKTTQFQFGAIFGIGVKNENFEIGYRYLHISNAGIERPNPGTDFQDIHVGYYF